MKTKMKRRVFSLLITLSMLLAIFSATAVATASAATTDIRLQAGTISGAPGATVFVPIELEVNQRDLGAIIYYISYDAARLELVNVAAGTVLPIPMGPPLGNNPLRVVHIDLSGVGAPVDVTGTLSIVEFRIRDTAPSGVTTVGLTSYDASGTISNLGERTHSSANGSVTVIGGTGGGADTGADGGGGTTDGTDGTGNGDSNYEASDTDDTDSASGTERTGGTLPRTGIDNNTLLLIVLIGVALLIATGTVIVLLKKEFNEQRKP